MIFQRKTKREREERKEEESIKSRVIFQELFKYSFCLLKKMKGEISCLQRKKYKLQQPQQHGFFFFLQKKTSLERKGLYKEKE